MFAIDNVDLNDDLECELSEIYAPVCNNHCYNNHPTISQGHYIEYMKTLYMYISYLNILNNCIILHSYNK